MKMKLTGLALILAVITFAFFSCAVADTSISPAEEKAIDNELNANLAKIMDIYARATVSDDPSLIAEFEAVIKEFDSKYQVNISAEYEKNAMESQSRLGGSSKPLPPLKDMPIKVDGAVYLSGGGSDVISKIVDYVSPSSTRGGYYHAAVLDIEKFDPTNLNSQCFQSAVPKGAGFETPNTWRNKINVAVLNPVKALNKAKLNASQRAMDYYCNPGNKKMQYGFFKGTVNVFSPVSKSNNFYWYCTKVVWRVYSKLGIDLDSNTNKVNWTKSGLYSFVKKFYRVRYFWSRKTANRKTKEYINRAKRTIVVADEMYYSPQLRRVYERVRRAK